MTKCRHTRTCRPDRTSYGEIVLNHGSDDRQWIMIHDRMARMERRIDEERMARVDIQVAATISAVRELAAAVGGNNCLRSTVEPRVVDLVSGKLRMWGFAVALSLLFGIAGIAGFAVSLLAAHMLG